MITHRQGLAVLSDESQAALSPLLTADKTRMLHFIGVKISDRIRAARTKAGLTQRALAARLGVDKSAVAQWEGGGGGVGIKTSNLVEVARVLGVRPSDLLGEPSHADRLVLEDTDEITLVTLFRGLPKALREAHLRLLYVSSDPGNVAQLSSHEPDRRQLVS